MDNGAKVFFNKQGFPIFESKFTVQISDPLFLKVERSTHFIICNDALKEAIKTDSILTRLFTNTDIAKIKDGILPSNFIWHHNQNSGILELVVRDVHEQIKHLGGHKIWGLGN